MNRAAAGEGTKNVMQWVSRALIVAACALAALLGVYATPSNKSDPPRAALGIEVPTLGGSANSFTDEAMLDIHNNLHAGYVRTGWIPNWIYRQQKKHRAWRAEDREMREICKFGLRVMIIVPNLKGDSKGEDDLLSNVSAFFTRYQAREPGCIEWAEVANEADLAVNGFKSVEQYAEYYARVAPIVASFGIPVITSGVSGEDRPWTVALAGLLAGMPSPPPVSGFGYHPYGTPVAELERAVAVLRQDAGGRDVYVTEIGQSTPDALYQTIVSLAHATPAITVFTYRPAARDEVKYSLSDNPGLHAAVERAWKDALATPREP